MRRLALLCAVHAARRRRRARRRRTPWTATAPCGRRRLAPGRPGAHQRARRRDSADLHCSLPGRRRSAAATARSRWRSTSSPARSRWCGRAASPSSFPTSCWRSSTTATGRASSPSPRKPPPTRASPPSTSPRCRPPCTDPEDETLTSVVEDSFLHVVWWQGAAASQHGTYALIRLTATPEDDEAPAIYNVDDFLQIGMACAMPAPQSVLEHPLFADQSLSDRALLFHGSRRACLFQLVEISFTLEEPPASSPSPASPSSAQRRRHTPVFGVRALYSVPRQMAWTTPASSSATTSSRLPTGSRTAHRVRQRHVQRLDPTLPAAGER